MASRRAVLGLGLAGALAAAPADARQAKEVKPEDLEKLKVANADLQNLVGNWEKVTHKCAENRNSEENCEPNLPEVGKYFGGKDPRSNLYDSEQLWINLQMGDQIDSADIDRFQTLTEDFERNKREVSNLVWTGQGGDWGNVEKTPSQKEDLLSQTKPRSVKAAQLLGEIMQILKL